ncbi:M61 family metallopeptidase [Chitinibacteraceae bacterium HSL-7]
MTKLHYDIRVSDAHGHYFDVELTIKKPDPAGQRLWLPVWIPGSYLIREFARNIVSISASVGKKPLGITKRDKSSWLLAPATKPVTVRYRVYAFDLSVRGAYLDDTRGFFNATSLCLAVAGQEALPVSVALHRPEGAAFKHWEVATTLSADGAKPWGFGQYHAENYDELIDHPVEMGEFTRDRFKACGVPHDIVLAGRHRADMARLKRDLKKICEYQIRLFGGKAPFDRYLFMTMVTGDGYGGLEHRKSTALMASRDDLPLAHETGIKAGYRQYLGLCSHEYFHSWNVKRLKPAAYAPYDLTQENYSRLLWAFEGITSYYDDLTLVRSGVISEPDYLELLSQTMTQVERGRGRLNQTLEEASFDTWIKYYRPDENSPNALASYYTQGALAALALDLTLRSEHDCSLDEVMRALWQRYGSQFDQSGVGIGEAEWEQVASDVARTDLSGFFDRVLRSTHTPDWPALFASVGVLARLRVPAGGSDKGGWRETGQPGNALGARVAADPLGVKLSAVINGGSAHAAGLSAGDVLLAFDGLRVTAATLETQLAAWPVGAQVQVHAFRRDELITRTLEIRCAEADTWGLRLMAEAAQETQDRRHCWLHAEH